MNDREDRNAILLHSINHEVVSRKDFANVLLFPFEYNGARQRESSQPFNRVFDSVDKAPSVEPRVSTNVGVDRAQSQRADSAQKIGFIS